MQEKKHRLILFWVYQDRAGQPLIIFHVSMMNTVLGVFWNDGANWPKIYEKKQGLAYYASSNLAGGLGTGLHGLPMLEPAPDNVGQSPLPELSRKWRGLQDEVVTI